MKTYVFSFLFLTIGISSTAQIVHIPDPAFKERLLNHELFGGAIIDTNGDDEIQVSEAEAITEVQVGDSFIPGDIVDMTGIEAFVNITELYCYNNVIAIMDLSQNILLEILDCQENNIETLDLSQNTALKNINCQDNQLVSLDVSHNFQLDGLICSRNQLSQLDVSNNALLSLIWCKENSLEMLDVRNGNNLNIISFIAADNPVLTCILVDDKEYSETNWTNIDPASSFVETQEECDLLSVGKNTRLHVSLFPNPVHDEINIALNYFTSDTSAELYDLNGKKVLNLNLSTTKTSIYVSHLSSGLFLLKIKEGSQNTPVSTFKIIKL